MTAGTSSSTTTPSKTPDPTRHAGASRRFGGRIRHGLNGSRAGEELGVFVGEQQVQLVEQSGVVGEERVVVDDPERRLTSEPHELPVPAQGRQPQVAPALLRRGHQRALAAEIEAELENSNE